MIRFTMPPAELGRNARIRVLNQQFDEFMHSAALQAYLRELGISSYDEETILLELEQYNTRKRKDGQIRESQEAPLNRVLEEHKNSLFQYYKEFGLLTVNKPQIDGYDEIVLLGGTANSNFDKTNAASKMITKDVANVTALSCFRPIPPGEKANCPYKGFYETEFGSFLCAFQEVFQLKEIVERGYSPKKSFDFPRNMNLAYDMRSFVDKDSRLYRVLACPSSNECARANTYDTYMHYLQMDPTKSRRVLVISNNQYVNYQFLGFAIAIFQSNAERVDFDIIGCTDDENLTDEKHYNTNQYFGDIKAMIEWIIKFRKLFICD